MSRAELVRQGERQPAGLVALKACMERAGWEVDHVDLDMTKDTPTVEVRMSRVDGRWLLARSDSLGRASIETFQRAKGLGMSPQTRGRRPLSPMVEDTFMGRQRCGGARALIRTLTNYIADNGTGDVSLGTIRDAWRGLMGERVLGWSGATEG